MATIVPGGERIREERQLQFEAMQARNEALAASWEAMRKPQPGAMAVDAFGMADMGRRRPMMPAPMPRFDPGGWTPEAWMAGRTREKGPGRPQERQDGSQGMAPPMRPERRPEPVVLRQRMRMR